MKIRMGFVSNSSSSSFVAILSKDAFDRVVASLGPIAQIISSSKWSSISHELLDGAGMVVYSSMSGNMDTCPLEEYYRSECAQFAQEALAISPDSEMAWRLREVIEILSEDEGSADGMARRLQKHSQKQQIMRDAVSELREMYYDGRSELEKALAALGKSGKCVIVRQDF